MGRLSENSVLSIKNRSFVVTAEIEAPVEGTRGVVIAQGGRFGYESGTPVSPDYTAATSRFTGRIHWVQLDLGDDDHGHFLDPEERFRIAIARQ